MREHRDKGEHVEEFTTVENIVAEVVQDNGQSHDLLRLIRTNHEASSAIENLKLEVASDEYEAVITLSNELYQQAEGGVLTASDADGQSLVITQAQPPEGSTEILTAAEIPAVNNEILTHQEGLLTETEAAAVQQVEWLNTSPFYTVIGKIPLFAIGNFLTNYLKLSLSHS